MSFLGGGEVWFFGFIVFGDDWKGKRRDAKTVMFSRYGVGSFFLIYIYLFSFHFLHIYRYRLVFFCGLVGYIYIYLHLKGCDFNFF